MTRGNNKHIVFRQHEDYTYYLKLIARYKALHPFDLYHYCLMPNHTHFLIQTKNANEFAIFMKKLSLAYFHYYNSHYGWVGHFWQGRYKSQPVGKDEYFIQCGRYIELNPSRSSLVAQPENYRYSSYGYYVAGRKDELITEDPFYTGLGKSPEQRRVSYENLLVSDEVVNSYKKRSWGGGKQTHNENEKMRYHFKK